MFKNNHSTLLQKEITGSHSPSHHFWGWKSRALGDRGNPSSHLCCSEQDLTHLSLFLPSTAFFTYLGLVVQAVGHIPVKIRETRKGHIITTRSEQSEGPRGWLRPHSPGYYSSAHLRFSVGIHFPFYFNIIILYVY